MRVTSKNQVTFFEAVRHDFSPQWTPSMAERLPQGFLKTGVSQLRLSDRLYRVVGFDIEQFERSCFEDHTNRNLSLPKTEYAPSILLRPDSALSPTTATCFLATPTCFGKANSGSATVLHGLAGALESFLERKSFCRALQQQA